MRPGTYLANLNRSMRRSDSDPPAAGRFKRPAHSAQCRGDCRMSAKGVTGTKRRWASGWFRVSQR
jgi:hypothetical protein